MEGNGTEEGNDTEVSMDVGAFLDSAAADGERAPASPKVLAQWEKDITVMRESIGLLLLNRVAEAEQRLQDATAEADSREIKFAEGDHDMRGGFAFVSAIMGLINGLASMENDQLDTVLQKVWAADKLLEVDADWAGKTVLRGLCLLVAGVVTIMQGTVARGVWHVLRSWLFLRHLESSGLNYQGHERECVRSTALLALGVFSLFTSMLPPQAMSAAGWITGFTGGREQAMVNLRLCWEEQGIQAPIAGLVLIGWAVDVSSFLGELRSEREPKHQEARKILDWAAEKYPGAFFYQGLECSYMCSRRDLPAAAQQLERIKGSVQDLPAFLFVVHLRRAVTFAACFDWAAAGEAYAAAVEVHRAKGRRALCPTLALNSHLCYVAGGDEAQAASMLELCLSYRKETKKWSPIDKHSLAAARLASEASLPQGALKADAHEQPVDDGAAGPQAQPTEELLPWRPLLLLYQKMCIVHRVVDFMTPEQADAFLCRVRSETDACEGDADSRCVGLWIQAEAMRQTENWEEALALAQACLQLKPQLGSAGRKSGALQFTKLIEAYARFAQGKVAEAKDALSQLQQLGNDHSFPKQVEFKATHLRRLVGAEFENSYTEVSVAARSKARLVVEVPDGTTAVEWDWLLNDFSISFVASARGGHAAAGPLLKELQRVDKHGAEDGPLTGSWEGTGPAVIELTFDNSFSMLRGKKVSIRLQPAGLKVARDDK